MEEFDKQNNLNETSQEVNHEFEVRLGDRIKLVDFNLKRSDRIIVRKLIGNRVRKLEDLFPKFQEIKLRLKKIHESQNNEKSKFLINASLKIEDKIFKTESEGFNLFMTLSQLFDKLEVLTKKEFNKL